MMRTILFHLNMFLLAACFLFGCSRRSSNPLLLQADSLLSVRPDSVLTMLDGLSGLEDMPAAYVFVTGFLLSVVGTGFGQGRASVAALRFVAGVRITLLR